MIKLSNVTKGYEGGKVLSSLTMVINHGDKIGLVGQNGVGKSTLLRIVAGEEKPDEGSVYVDHEDVIGYLPQTIDLDGSITVRDFLLEPYQQIQEGKQRLEELGQRMTEELTPDELERVLAEYGRIQTEFEAAGGYDFEDRFEAILKGLGLKVDLESKMPSLSGGQKARVSIARMLLQNPTVLLLDEPTNHLDMPALIWLESYLSEEGKTLVVVSHDRRFLDKVVNRIIEIDPDTHGTVEFGGNYSDYLEEKVRLFEKTLQDYEQQQKRFKALEKDVARTKDQALRTEFMTKDSTMRRYSKKVAKKAVSREKRLKRQMSAEDVIRKPEERQLAKIALQCSATRETLAVVDKVKKSFGGQPVLSECNLRIRGGEKVAIVGENGSGKTTLIKVILGQIIPDSGQVELNSKTKLGYLPQEHHHLPKNKRVLEWFRNEVPMHEDEARSFLGSMAFSQESLFRMLSTLSEGELSRLLVSVLVAGCYNLLLLDEPTNHLDFESVELVESALQEYEGAVIAITHDRYFMEEVGFDRILLLEGGTLREYVSWQDYEQEVASTSKGGVK